MRNSIQAQIMALQAKVNAYVRISQTQYKLDYDRSFFKKASPHTQYVGVFWYIVSTGLKGYNRRSRRNKRV